VQQVSKAYVFQAPAGHGVGIKLITGIIDALLIEHQQLRFIAVGKLGLECFTHRTHPVNINLLQHFADVFLPGQHQHFRYQRALLWFAIEQIAKGFDQGTRQIRPVIAILFEHRQQRSACQLLARFPTVEGIAVADHQTRQFSVVEIRGQDHRCRKSAKG